MNIISMINHNRIFHSGILLSFKQCILAHSNSIQTFLNIVFKLRRFQEIQILEGIHLKSIFINTSLNHLDVHYLGTNLCLNFNFLLLALKMDLDCI